MILDKACWYLNSTAKQIHPSLQCSFKLARVMQSISLSCARAGLKRWHLTTWVGGSTRATLFSIYRARAVYETGLCFQCMRRYSLNLTKMYWIRTVHYTFNVCSVCKFLSLLKAACMYSMLALKPALYNNKFSFCCVNANKWVLKRSGKPDYCDHCSSGSIQIDVN